MATTSHRRLGRQVDAYVDGELDSERRAAVRDHVDRCPDCSGAARTAALIKASLGRLRQPPALATARLQRWARDLSR